MTPNGTLRTLDADEPAVGGWLTSMNPRVAEVTAATDVNWIGVDAERSPISTQRVESVPSKGPRRRSSVSDPSKQRSRATRSE